MASRAVDSSSAILNSSCAVRPSRSLALPGSLNPGSWISDLGVLLALDVRLGDAPLVDAVADGLLRLLDGLLLEVLDDVGPEGEPHRAFRRAAGGRHLGPVEVLDHLLDLLRVGGLDLDAVAVGRRARRGDRQVLPLEEVEDLVGAADDLGLHGPIDVHAHGQQDAALQVEAEVQVLLRVGRPAGDRLLERRPVSLAGGQAEVGPGGHELPDGPEEDGEDEPQPPVPVALHLLLLLGVLLGGAGLVGP